MSTGSNPGADVVNFRFHITDINASLQSSSVVSVENDQTMPGGNKGATVTEKIEKQIQEHKHKTQQIDAEIQRIDVEIQRVQVENQVLRKEIKRRHRDTKPKTQEICIKCDSPAVVHRFCANWCEQCWNTPTSAQLAVKKKKIIIMKK